MAIDKPVGKAGKTVHEVIAPPVLVKVILAIAISLTDIGAVVSAIFGARGAFTVISTVAVSLPVTFVAVTV